VTRSEPAPQRDPFVQIAIRTSGVYQYWKISGKALGTFTGSNSSVGGIAGGVELAIERYHLVLTPRVAVVFGEESQIEIGADVGSRFARQLSSGRLGIDLLFTPMLFPGVASEGQGFYYGGRADVFFERGRFRVVVGVGYGHIATFKPDATVNTFELGLAFAL